MPLRIIREVEKWPVIYKKDSPEMINTHFKYKVWEEVANNLIENFQIYTAAERQSKVNDLMKKWRNLRDTFKRHLKVEKKNREGHNIRRKEYVYFKHMSFLLPHMIDDEAQERAAAAPTASRPRPRRAPPARRRRHLPVVEAPSPPPFISAIEHVDADKHFLLSLLPSFKHMSEDEKLTAKMEILKVIKDAKNISASLQSSFEAHDIVTPADARLDDEPVVVKNELLTAEVSDYKPPCDSGSGDIA